MLTWMIVAIAFMLIASAEAFYILYKSTHNDKTKDKEVEDQLLKTEKDLRILADKIRNIK